MDSLSIALVVMLSLLVATFVKVCFIACVRLLRARIIFMPMAICVLLASSSQILKYSICFSTSMFWISTHFSSNITLVALIQSIDSTRILLPFSTDSTMFL